MSILHSVSPARLVGWVRRTCRGAAGLGPGTAFLSSSALKVNGHGIIHGLLNISHVKLPVRDVVLNLSFYTAPIYYLLAWIWVDIRLNWERDDTSASLKHKWQFLWSDSAGLNESGLSFATSPPTSTWYMVDTEKKYEKLPLNIPCPISTIAAASPRLLTGWYETGSLIRCMLLVNVIGGPGGWASTTIGT